MAGMGFGGLFEIDNKHRILICTKCQYAIGPSHLATHLKGYHSRLTLEQHGTYVAKVDSFSALAHYHKDVVYPTPNDPPVPILPVYFDGLRCDWVDNRNLACAYVCHNLPLMPKHCKEKHGCKSVEGMFARNSFIRRTRCDLKIVRVNGSSRSTVGRSTLKWQGRTKEQSSRGKHPGSMSFSGPRKKMFNKRSMMLLTMRIEYTGLTTMSPPWSLG